MLRQGSAQRAGHDLDRVPRSGRQAAGAFDEACDVEAARVVERERR